MTEHVDVAVRHLLRKHVMQPELMGKALLHRCAECGRVGNDSSQGVVHSTTCKYASIMKSLGAIVQTGSANASRRATKETSLEECIS